MASKIINVIKRNFQIYSNSKLSSFIMVLGPLFLIIIMGLFLQNTSLKNVKAGVFSEDISLRDNFVKELNSRSFIADNVDSLEECKERVIDEIDNVCIHLKRTKDNVGIEDYSTGYQTYDVDLYVDFSKQRIVWSIINSVGNVVREESYKERGALVKNLREDASILNSEITYAEESLDSAHSLLISLREEASITSSELNDVSSSLQASESILRRILDAGVLPSPYSSDVYTVIVQLSSSEEKIKDVKDSIFFRTGLEDIEASIINTKNDLNRVHNELNNIEELNVDRLSNPISMSYYSASGSQGGTVAGEELGLVNYIFPSFIIFFLMFSSLLMSTIMIIKERKSGAYIRNTTSTSKGSILIIGNFLTILIITIIQILIVSLISIFFLNISVFTNIYSFLGIILISITIFSLLGFFVGYSFKSYESAISASTSLALLFFIFSSSIIPAETLPKILADGIKLSPLTLLETKIRVLLIFNKVLSFNLYEILALSLVFSIICLAVLFSYKHSKEKEI